MLPGRLQILHASRKPQEKNLIPLCSAVISSLDSGTAKKRSLFCRTRREGATENRMRVVTSQ